MTPDQTKGEVTQSPTGDPLADGLVLRVPRAIPAMVLTLGAVWAVPLALAVAADGVANPPVQTANAVVATVLLWFGLETALIRVRIDAQAVTLRRRLRSTTVPLAAVKGIALLADRGTPRLRVVTADGAIQVPAWSMRAHHPDGEVEPAAAALPRFGDAHGIKVHVRVLTGPRTT